MSTENAQAWRWGPVFPELYHEVKWWGSESILEPIVVDEFDDGEFQSNIPKISSEDSFAQKLIKRIWDVYGHMSGIDLSRLTHEKDGPWYKTWSTNSGARNVEIPNETILEYFATKIQANAERT